MTEKAGVYKVLKLVPVDLSEAQLLARAYPYLLNSSKYSKKISIRPEWKGFFNGLKYGI